MELTHYSGTSFYIKNQEWGEKMIQSFLPLPAMPYNTEDVNTCGPSDPHQILWKLTIFKTHQIILPTSTVAMWAFLIQDNKQVSLHNVSVYTETACPVTNATMRGDMYMVS